MAEQTAHEKFLALLNDEERNKRIKQLLPNYLELERFKTNARALLRNKDLYGRDSRTGQQTLAVTPESLYQCVEDAARRGLEIGGSNKHCAVVKFKSTAVLITQWQGKVFQWMKAGAIKKAYATCVFVGDEFRITLGDEQHIEHIPDDETNHSPGWYNDLNNIRGAYAVATLWSGEKLISWVNRSKLNRIREWVTAKNEGELGFGWRDWLPEMCCKTAIHRLEGQIQPPPNMSTEQIEAWNRAGAVDTSVTLVHEPEQDNNLLVGELTEDETPRARSEPEVARQEILEGEPITAVQMTQRFTERADGKPWKTKFGLRQAEITKRFPNWNNDFSNIPAEHYPQILALLETL
jgi:recombinational DNA repair protein RecT